MKILVTGSKGFIGKNLISELNNKGYTDIYEYDIDTPEEMLDNYTVDCEFVFHLAGINRPKCEEDFVKGNVGFTETLLNKLKANSNKSTIVVTSSIQAALDNPYGKSKKAGEELLFDYTKNTGVKTIVYRLPNVFGKWCRPNYNSVIATFCNNIACGEPITINDPNVELKLVYIDDVVKEFICALDGSANVEDEYGFIPKSYTVRLGEIASLIQGFKESRENLLLPDVGDEFSKKLYSTYLSYLPKDKFSYPVKTNVDNRGSFTELFKTENKGQVSVNISKPGITKGNHWHHTKNEKFVVVKGEGIIRFRKIDSTEVIEYKVSDKSIEIVDIPCGYTHNIENTGDTDLVTIMWANELFDKDNPDTMYMEV